MFLFQLPLLPEYLSSNNNFAATAESIQQTSRPGTFSDADLERYREAWARSDRLRGPINWYRAGFRASPARPADIHVHVPLLILWGTQDAFLLEAMAVESLDYCDDGRLERFENAGHWVLHEEPERTSQLIADFFSAD
jgi:pimeloyl-ACP methyl ester carboxylesterase